jgi:hypothetical protein
MKPRDLKINSLAIILEKDGKTLSISIEKILEVIARIPPFERSAIRENIKDDLRFSKITKEKLLQIF